MPWAVSPGELDEIELAATEANSSLHETNRQQTETRDALGEAQRNRSAIKSEQDRAQETLGPGDHRPQDAGSGRYAPAACCKPTEVDIEAAATGATTKGHGRMRRVTDAILRIGVEAAEDERAIHELGESGLLPPARDVESLVDWLRRRKVTSWSGWKYIEENVSTQERREELVERAAARRSGSLVWSGNSRARSRKTTK